MSERGISEDEVAQTIESGALVAVQSDRKIRSRVFASGYRWNRRLYPHKEVTVVYAEGQNVLTVITAIARYGIWEPSS